MIRILKWLRGSLPFAVFGGMLLAACSKKESSDTLVKFDPSKPVTISRFTPDSGGVGTQMLIYGSNFGSDRNLVKVFINGKPAPVIGVKDTIMYVLVPSRAGEGKLTLQIGKEGDAKEVVAAGDFKYLFNQSVGTLAGFTDKDGKTAIVDGEIAKAQFEEPYWLTFDQHKNIYMLEEYRGMRFIDSARTYVKTMFRTGNGLDRPRTLAFNPTWDTLYVTNDQWDDRGLSTAVLTPATGFTKWNALILSKTTNGGDANPITGDFFFNSYSKGEMFKWDRQSRSTKFMYRVDDVDWEFNIQFAPSGDFAYIVVVNKSYILRTRFNKETGTLEAPVHFVGGRGQHDYRDGIGVDARFNHPHQGTFDKDNNFYVADAENHCIRKISPEGVVSTFAGRPRERGYADGPLRKAQFNLPRGIVYDDATATFYVADQVNRRIRTISVE
ncbi:NHL repeat-containing protein [Chitinophaga terrae (ex Kim and Jung 2007)]|jgi:DNA-binding beta-propeller fold protein YncE|uniref:NHL repeat-containing protein n=1 Tax=Chitinophaga terrae (ex Kim and Jung 2007) TaxID=408074 RepID=A0A1H3ZLM1_9BACT|nr:IPT/TIG domain-containing protein [Chitinophaga terrae (ex Kim and Jung 2007)]MDQ0107415.1 DNA-binding beta-propeller fold protein YncE [Chitinophaga terrae (ex Kim and Jung 2007)]SEA24535.1 NHL repeat-containing protein [Chitinophaga terrae (ex Kim and Jung 2007)]